MTATSESESPRRLATLSAVLLAQATGTLPMFLVGALAVLMQSDIDFTAGQLGICISLFFATSAVLSVPSGMLCDHLGPRRALAFSVVISAVSLLGLATVTSSWVGVAAMTALAGAANSVTQPSVNLAIVRGITSKHGFAFGVKQSSAPVATMVAGAAVPVIGLTYGWRWAFAAGAVCVAVVSLSLRFLLPTSVGNRPAAGDLADAPLVGMIVLAVAIIFANGAVTSLGSFFVQSSVDGGIAPGPAGVLLIVGSVAMITGRVGSGVLADRRGGPRVTSLVAMMVVGAAGFAVLSLASEVLLVAVAAIIAFGFGWGWTGLFHHYVVSINPRGPGRATGISSIGLRVGGMIGPTSFGLIAEYASFATAWRVMAAMLLISSSLLLVARGVLRRGETAPA